MIRHLQALISLRNLTRRRGGRRGQVATYMLLLITAALIGTLTMANLGNLALTSTSASNAADGAALLLASQLANKSHQLWEALGQRTKKCKFGGFLGIILAVVVAIILIVIAIFVPVVWAAVGPVIAAIAGAIAVAGISAAVAGVIAATLVMAVIGAVGGAIGGAIGGGIAGGWDGAAWGALQGAQIGAAIGAAAGGLADPVSFFAILTAELGTVVAPSTVMIAAAALGTLSAAASLYNGYVVDQDAASAQSRAAKVLNRLPEPQRIRETVFFYTLSHMVDDPNKTAKRGPGGSVSADKCYWSTPVQVTGDPDDVDGDGDRRDQVGCFWTWWRRRQDLIYRNLLVGVNRLPDQLQRFLGQLGTFAGRVEAQYQRGRLLSRGEIEGAGCTPGAPTCSWDGSLVTVMRALHAAGHRVRLAAGPNGFWSPGPTRTELQNYYDDDRANCDDEFDACGVPPPRGLDDLDAMIEELGGLVELIRELQGSSPDQLMSSMHTWVRFFYDPDSTEDYYDTLYNAMDGSRQVGTVTRLRAWKNELIRIRNNLPACTCAAVVPGVGCSTVDNAPCHGGPLRPATFATIDTDMQDEFVPAIQDVDRFINEIMVFRTQAEQAYNDMIGLREHIGGLYSLPNPVTYTWEDARGVHSVKVEVGPFALARHKVVKKFLKTCTVLRDYADDGSRAWVKVARTDPAGAAVGGDHSSDPAKPGLWSWNSGMARGGAVEKISRAEYSYNFVRLRRTR